MSQHLGATPVPCGHGWPCCAASIPGVVWHVFRAVSGRLPASLQGSGKSKSVEIFKNSGLHVECRTRNDEHIVNTGSGSACAWCTLNLGARWMKHEELSDIGVLLGFWTSKC